jgi:hypothetical protein
MKVYCTEYALTAGITQHEVLRELENGGVVVKWPGGVNGVHHLFKGDWKESRVEAIRTAEEMRAAKIRSLRRQIEMLEAMTFAIKEGDAPESQ